MPPWCHHQYAVVGPCPVLTGWPVVRQEQAPGHGLEVEAMRVAQALSKDGAASDGVVRRHRTLGGQPEDFAGKILNHCGPRAFERVSRPDVEHPVRPEVETSPAVVAGGRDPRKQDLLVHAPPVDFPQTTHPVLQAVADRRGVHDVDPRLGGEVRVQRHPMRPLSPSW